MKELSVLFSIPSLYTKHRNNKYEVYAMALGDLDLSKNIYFLLIRFCEAMKKELFHEDLVSRIREKSFLREDLTLKMIRHSQNL